MKETSDYKPYREPFNFMKAGGIALLIVGILHGILAVILFWVGAFEKKICEVDDTCLANASGKAIFAIFMCIIFSVIGGIITGEAD